MGQLHSFDDADYATITPGTKVPMLDWPSDLFSDNACPTDLATVDFLLPCDADFMPNPYQNERSYVRLAA